MKTFEVEIGGIKRRYPIVTLSEGVRGVYFFLPGDLELTERCAELISERISGLTFDIIMVPEAGAIPLAHSLARQARKDYLVIRKEPRPYMEQPIVESINSITYQGKQKLVLDARDIPKIKGKKVLIVDDVVSTGGTLKGLAQLVSKCESRLSGIATIFLEGATTADSLEAHYGCPVVTLGYLPLFADNKVKGTN